MSEQTAFDIEEVSLNTGIGKDTLRVWERRYGFPVPLRGENGERRYSLEQLQRLHKIQHLLDQGCRPGKVVGLTEDGLQVLLTDLNNGVAKPTQAIQELLSLISGDQPKLLRQALQDSLTELGLQRLLEQILSPLVCAIGNAWAVGKLSIYAEHMATQTIQRVLTDAIGQVTDKPTNTRAVLTTLPGERHILGLLMAEATMAVHGVETINLGTETPLAELCNAAAHYNADAVLLSFSQIQSRNIVVESLRSLSAQLPLNTRLIIGGNSIAQYRSLPGRIEKYDLVGLARWCEQQRDT
jgi:DNA-binding transcriptional MerR regulator/methylmalonyl-CoA mutase cobalamin-binding subunit